MRRALSACLPLSVYSALHKQFPPPPSPVACRISTPLRRRLAVPSPLPAHGSFCHSTSPLAAGPRAPLSRLLASLTMCPMRIFVFLFSALLLLYFSLKWAAQPDHKAEDPVQASQSKVRTRALECLCASVSRFSIYLCACFCAGWASRTPACFVNL